MLLGRGRAWVRLAMSLSGNGTEPLYRIKASVRGEKPFTLETLAHRYAWESYHSAVNAAGGVLVPSKSFSTHRSLRAAPQTFDQIEDDGRKASISLDAPAGMKGEILFLREDLVSRYLKRRTIVWFAFGERRLYGAPDSPPQWYADQVRKGKNGWQVARDAAELVTVLRERERTARRKRTVARRRRKR
jgi:hypothetical protein